MTAADAITRMRTEVDELERKQLLRPNLIAAKRQWIDTVAAALHEQQDELHRMQQHLQQLKAEHRETDLRLGMLANVLNILGFEPWRHLQCPLEGHTYTAPDVYQLAAQQQEEQDRRQGLANRMHLLRFRKELDGILSRALWHARLTLMLAPFQHLIQQHTANHGQEERTAA